MESLVWMYQWERINGENLKVEKGRENNTFNLDWFLELTKFDAEPIPI